MKPPQSTYRKHCGEAEAASWRAEEANYVRRWLETDEAFNPEGAPPFFPEASE